VGEPRRFSETVSGRVLVSGDDLMMLGVYGLHVYQERQCISRQSGNAGDTLKYGSPSDSTHQPDQALCNNPNSACAKQHGGPSVRLLC
jgi:hypothetical protein